MQYAEGTVTMEGSTPSPLLKLDKVDIMVETLTVTELARVTGHSTSTIRDTAIRYEVYDEVHDEVILTDEQLDVLFALNKDT